MARKPRAAVRVNEDVEAVVDEESCLTCRYFRRANPVATLGTCQRNPPNWSPTLACAEWPRVAASDWCGEWRGAKEAAR